MIAKHKNHPFFGVVVGVLSSLLFALMAISVQKVSNKIPIQETSFVRGFISALILFPMVFAKVPSLFKKEAKYVWLRSLAGGIAVICYFWNTKMGSAGEARALANTSPIFVAIFSYILYKEVLSKIELLGLVILFLGSMGLMYHVVQTQSFLIYLVGSVGAFFTGIAYLSLKQASKNYSTRLIVFAFSTAVMMVSFASKTENWVIPHGSDLFYLLCVGIFGMLGQLTLTVSHYYLKNAIASALTILNMVFLVLWDIGWTHRIELNFQITYYVLITIGIVIMTSLKKSK